MTDDLKTKILDASLELMKDGDLSALSMRAVARSAGVSHQAPYHYFEDREAILAELVRQGFEKLYAYEKEAYDKVTSRRDRVIELGRAYVRFALENQALFKLMFRKDMVDPSCHDGAHEAAEKAFDLPIQIIGDAHEGLTDRPETAVVGFWSLAHGLASLLLEGKFDKKMDKFDLEVDDLVEQTLVFFARNLPD